MTSRTWAITLGLLCVLASAQDVGSQDPTANEWIFVADKLSLLQKYVEGSELGTKMKDRNLRARLLAFETAAVVLSVPRADGMHEIRINVRRSTRLETFAVPKEDYEALVKFARETALERSGEGPVLKR